MLHIHNGDATAETAKRSALPGEHFAFREALVEGPTPAGLNIEDWRRVRARHLSESYDIEVRECEGELAEQENKLTTFAEHDEFVLWFEHDLFCQVNLLYLLNWFSQRDLHDTRLSLVSVDQFPGITDFRGLGQLNAEQLASLFPDRIEVNAAMLNLASNAWQAYCSPNPTAIEKFLQTDTSALPFLRAALRAHLKRFPSVRNGLGAIEDISLGIAVGGTNRFVDLFRDFGNAEPIYGLGDTQFWLALRRLSEASEPLVLSADGNKLEQKLDADKVGSLALEVTDRGRAVLSGEADFVTLNGIDMWLGGVHLLSPDNVWRWDEQTQFSIY